MNLVSIYAKPLTSLLSDWSTKLAIGFGAALLEAATRLSASEPHLILLIVVLLFLDFLTGIVASLARKEKIRSGRLRQTVVKTLEYGILLVAATAIGNSFAILSWLPTTAYLFVAITEFYSIGENLVSEGVREVFRRLTERMLDKTPTDTE